MCKLGKWPMKMRAVYLLNGDVCVCLSVAGKVEFLERHLILVRFRSEVVQIQGSYFFFFLKRCILLYVCVCEPVCVHTYCVHG